MTQLSRALLIPFDDRAAAPNDAATIALDFNPETLVFRVAGVSTLSFEAIFDTTRPKDTPADEPDGASIEQLDVRRRTGPIAALARGAPKRVRFVWGSIVFDGVVEGYTEVLEYFSPEGVPLRSRVSVSMRERSPLADARGPDVPAVAHGGTARALLEPVSPPGLTGDRPLWEELPRRKTCW